MAYPILGAIPWGSSPWGLEQRPLGSCLGPSSHTGALVRWRSFCGEKMAKKYAWQVGLGQTDLVTAPVRTGTVGGLASPGEVGGRWQRGLPVCLEHGALLGNWDTGVPQGQGLQV